MEVVQQIGIDLALGRRARDGPTVVEDALRYRHRFGRGPELGMGACFFGQLGESVLDSLQIRQDQLGVHGADVRLGIDTPVDMDHVIVMKDPDHLADGIALPDGSEELVAQPFAL
jgi:hypothetical protein